VDVDYDGSWIEDETIVTGTNTASFEQGIDVNGSGVVSDVNNDVGTVPATSFDRYLGYTISCGSKTITDLLVTSPSLVPN
jgi:hypothetical protein